MLIGLSSSWLGQGRREFHLHTTGFDEEGAQSLTFVHKFLFIYLFWGWEARQQMQPKKPLKTPCEAHWQRDGRSHLHTTGFESRTFPCPRFTEGTIPAAITPGLFLHKFPTLELRARYNTQDSGTFPVLKSLTTFLNSRFSI